MAQVITLELYRPAARYDEIPWTQARIEEGTTEDGPWVALETIALDPVDTDPENPASRNLTTELADDAYELWYRIIFVDATGDESLPTVPIQNLADFTAGTAYATVVELARSLKIRTPSADQEIALARVLVTAAGEIDSEVNLAEGLTLEGWQLALAAEVNLTRAKELWKEQEVEFGLLGVGSEFGATRIAVNTWEKHAVKLAPLKGQWGLA